MITAEDRRYLYRAVELAEVALSAGDEPFGSVLVSQNGVILFEDHNHVAQGDHTQHPEFALARWAVEHLSPEERRLATVYTSGEHCPMCAAAHGWVGLGRIVYAAASSQLSTWLQKWGVPAPPVATLPITTIVPGAEVDGPDDTLAQRVRELHRRRWDPTAQP